MNLTVVVDLTSVGTLFAFVLVCGGILSLQNDPHRIQSRFKTPYVNSRYITISLFVLFLVLVAAYSPGGISGALSFTDAEGHTSWQVARTKIPYLLFGVVFAVTALLSFLRNYSLIPVLGFLSCSYLLCESGVSNWERFLIWLIIGLIVYFIYGSRHSKLRKAAESTAESVGSK
jgi:Mn2+/Fe2+ NRAMP family transporter